MSAEHGKPSKALTLQVDTMAHPDKTAEEQQSVHHSNRLTLTGSYTLMLITSRLSTGAGKCTFLAVPLALRRSTTLTTSPAVLFLFCHVGRHKAQRCEG